MTIVDDSTRRDRWIAQAAAVQLTLQDMQRAVDAAMQTRPAPGVIKLLAMCDVHLENASEELAEAAKDIGALP